MGKAIAIRQWERGSEKKSRTFEEIALALLALMCFYPFNEESHVVFAGAVLFMVLVLLLFSPRRRPEKVLTIEELVNHAREETSLDHEFQAERYYCQAIYRLLISGRRLEAAGVFEQYFISYHRVFAPRIQLEICRELCQSGRYLTAARALEKLIEDWSGIYRHLDRKFLEQAYLHLARIYAEKLKLPALATGCYFAFLEKFPKSVYRDTALYQLQVMDEETRLAA